MKKIIFTLLLIPFLFSCEKEKFYPPACPGGCFTNHEIIYKNDTINIDGDGFFNDFFGKLLRTDSIISVASLPALEQSCFHASLHLDQNLPKSPSMNLFRYV